MSFPRKWESACADPRFRGDDKLIIYPVHTNQQKLPIGVFDSGLGGLTVVREITKRLPHENIIYFGDLARVPYGIKSKRQITDFSIENSEFLMRLGVKAIVIACNSSASAAAHVIRRRFDVPVFDVIRPAAEEAIRRSKRKRIGIIGTQATVASKTYPKLLESMDSSTYSISQACPLFVPLVEEGILNGEIAGSTVKQYLKPLVREKIDTLILGCTHYPLLKNVIQQFVGSNVNLIDSAAPTVEKIGKVLKQKRLLNQQNKKGRLAVFVSDLPQNFVKSGGLFLGKSQDHVKLVKLTEVMMVKRRWKT